MFVIPDANMAGIITAIQLQMGTAITGAVKIHLYTSNLSPTKANVLADFTAVELTNVQVPGYAPAAANWFAGVPFRRNDGQWEAPDSVADPSFVATGPPPAPQVVYGWFATDSTNAILLGSGLFAVPFTFTLTGDGFDLPGNPLWTQQDALTATLTLPDLEPA